MSLSDDVAAIAAEHGPDVAMEYFAQSTDAVFDGISGLCGMGDFIRLVWRDFKQQLALAGYRAAAASGAEHETAYYRTEGTPWPKN